MNFRHGSMEKYKFEIKIVRNMRGDMWLILGIKS